MVFVITTSTFCLTWSLGKGDAVDVRMALVISLRSNQTVILRAGFNSNMGRIYCIGVQYAHVIQGFPTRSGELAGLECEVQWELKGYVFMNVGKKKISRAFTFWPPPMPSS